MGNHILRVKAKPIVTDGVTYYDCVYAYKPYSGFGGTDKYNDRMCQRHCGNAIKAWDKRPYEERRNVLVNHLGSLHLLKYCGGAIWDYALDKRPLGQVHMPYHRPRFITLFHPRTDITEERLRELEAAI